MHDSLMAQGLSLLVYGMGTVFVFLALLVVITTAMSRLIHKFFPDLPEPERAARNFQAAPSPQTVEPRVLAVITAAVAQHRAKRRAP